MSITYNSPTADVLAWAHQNAARLGFADRWDLVGRWVWVRFTTKPSADTRAEMTRAGFRFNSKRGEWYHWCAVPARRPKGKTGPAPRSIYGSIPGIEIIPT